MSATLRVVDVLADGLSDYYKGPKYALSQLVGRTEAVPHYQSISMTYSVRGSLIQHNYPQWNVGWSGVYWSEAFDYTTAWDYSRSFTWNRVGLLDLVGIGTPHGDGTDGFNRSDPAEGQCLMLVDNGNTDHSYNTAGQSRRFIDPKRQLPYFIAADKTFATSAGGGTFSMTAHDGSPAYSNPANIPAITMGPSSLTPRVGTIPRWFSSIVPALPKITGWDYFAGEFSRNDIVAADLTGKSDLDWRDLRGTYAVQFNETPASGGGGYDSHGAQYPTFENSIVHEIQWTLA